MILSDVTLRFCMTFVCLTNSMICSHELLMIVCVYMFSLSFFTSHATLVHGFHSHYLNKILCYVMYALIIPIFYT
jgi:hypothetical protein